MRVNIACLAPFHAPGPESLYWYGEHGPNSNSFAKVGSVSQNFSVRTSIRIKCTLKADVQKNLVKLTQIWLASYLLS